MVASEPNADENEPKNDWDPVEFATEMLDGYFARPVIVTALVAKGVDPEVARDIVVKLQKERYLQVDLEKKKARQFNSRCLMAGGTALLLFSIAASFYASSKIIRQEGGGFVVYWGPICTGLIILLYGFSKRKSI